MGEGWRDGEGSRHRGQGGRRARNACVKETEDNESRNDHVATKTNMHACTFTLSHPHTIHFHTVTPSHHPLPHCHTLTLSTSTLSNPPTIYLHTHTLPPSTSTHHPPPHPHIIPPTCTASATAELDCNTLLLPRLRDPAECFFPIFSFCEGCWCDGVGGSDISDTSLRIDDCADLRKEREGEREGGRGGGREVSAT